MQKMPIRRLAFPVAATTPASLACSGMRLDEFAEKLGGVFAEFAVVGTKGGGDVAVDVEFADNFSFCENRNDNFRFCFERAGKIARIAVHVVHDNSLSARSSRATDALVERNTRVWRSSAAKRAEDKHVGVIGIEHVEADPVVARELFVQQADDGVHQGVGVRSAGREFIEF